MPEIRKPKSEDGRFFTNDLKKGDRIQLRCGWYATIEDNMRGLTRICTVEGDFTEMGSVYSHDILTALINNVWQPIFHTKEQLILRRKVG